MARRFLKQAEEELIQGDYLQAPEKMWGAAACIIKEAGEKLQMQHDRHGHLFTIADKIAREIKDEEIRAFFNIAHTLHVNFYESCFPSSHVKKSLKDIRNFVHKVECAIPKLSAG